MKSEKKITAVYQKNRKNQQDFQREYQSTKEGNDCPRLH